MKRPRYPDKFNTKREMLWYIKGMKDAKTNAIQNIESEEKRYLDGMYQHMDFDKNGNVLDYRIENLEWTSQSKNMTGVRKFDDKYINRHAVLEEKGQTFEF